MKEWTEEAENLKWQLFSAGGVLCDEDHHHQEDDHQGVDRHPDAVDRDVQADHHVVGRQDGRVHHHDEAVVLLCDILGEEEGVTVLLQDNAAGHLAEELDHHAGHVDSQGLCLVNQHLIHSFLG